MCTSMKFSKFLSFIDMGMNDESFEFSEVPFPLFFLISKKVRFSFHAHKQNELS